MRRGIVRCVGFRLDDETAGAADGEIGADQFARDGMRGAGEETREMARTRQPFLHVFMKRRRSLPWMFLASACFEQSSDLAVRCGLLALAVEAAAVGALDAGAVVWAETGLAK